MTGDVGYATTAVTRLATLIAPIPRTSGGGIRAEDWRYTTSCTCGAVLSVQRDVIRVILLVVVLVMCLVVMLILCAVSMLVEQCLCDLLIPLPPVLPETNWSGEKGGVQ